jgi:MFS family permease
VAERAIGLAFTARFVDELASGAWLVLAPVFRRVFGLSLVQVGLLTQVLNWVALAVEPVTASLIDVASRRRLMAFGATAIAASMLVSGTSLSYGALLAGAAIFGMGSGPLAHTADVVVVQSFPRAPERAFTRATFLDTTGAMLGPALVAGAAALGLSWRVVLIGLGVAIVPYALAVSGTPYPAPPGRPVDGVGFVRAAVSGMRQALDHPTVRQAVLVLLCFEVFEAAFVLKYVWLHEVVGLSEAAVALWASAEQVVDLVALAVLDRWLRSVDGHRLLRAAAVTLVALPTLFVLAPGMWGRIAVGIPLTFAYAMVWPIAKSRSLVAAPELAGAIQAITTLFPLAPMALLEAWLAQAMGMGPAMALTAAAGAAGMLAASRGTKR